MQQTFVASKEMVEVLNFVASHGFVSNFSTTSIFKPLIIKYKIYQHTVNKLRSTHIINLNTSLHAKYQIQWLQWLHNCPCSQPIMCIFSNCNTTPFELFPIYSLTIKESNGLNLLINRFNTFHSQTSWKYGFSHHFLFYLAPKLTRSMNTRN